MMWKFGKHCVTDVAGFKMSEQVDQIGRSVRHIAWPFVIRVCELTKEIPVPVWSMGADLHLFFDTAQESAQRSLCTHERHSIAR